MSYKWHHYSVREIVVNAKCNCNGHGDGYNCPLNSTTGLQECTCASNTCGANCESCCPGHHQFPWQQGESAPWAVDPEKPCYPCNCHGHADDCYYNQTVANNNMSLDATGQMRGGGVCLNCIHNTEGINCQHCQKLFYRPSEKSPADIDGCAACACNEAGAADVDEIDYLDCVRNEADKSNHEGKEPGDCYCKTKVTGSKCDTCIDEYYGLDKDLTEGCKECGCFLNGTVDRSNICSKDSVGQCPCKSAVQQRECNECRDGYYDLQNNNTEGCKECECDVGGAPADSICDKINGECQCRPNVTGHFCDRVASGYFYPDVHHLHIEKDPYKGAQDSIKDSINIPKSSLYHIFIGYMLDQDQSVDATLTMKHTETGEIIIYNETLTKQTSYSRHAVNGHKMVSIPSGLWIVTLQSSTDSTLKVERINFIPKEFYEDTVLGNATGKFLFQCSVDANDMRIGELGETFCLQSVFSLTMAFWDGSLPCNCNPLGSKMDEEFMCLNYTGKCTCKDGVEGRDCSRCEPGFFNFTSEGCQPCGCLGNDNVCDVVTGQCNCPDNTVGRVCDPCPCNGNSDQCLRSGVCLNCQNNTSGTHCELCINGTFGEATNQTCNMCRCDSVGSKNQFCDRVSGQCDCQEFFIGRSCDQCEVNYYNFSSTACSPCECNDYGSEHLQCDSEGTCNCTDGAKGKKCTECKLGYYGLPDMTCQDCACNSTGSINDTFCSNDVFGTCDCKNGVAGRACDDCATLHHNFGDTGCEMCPACIFSLQGLIDSAIDIYDKAYNQSIEMEKMTVLHEEVEKIHRQWHFSQISGSKYDEDIAKAKLDYHRIADKSLVSVNASLANLMNKVALILSKGVKAVNATAETLMKVTDIHNKTIYAKNYVDNVNTVVQSTLESTSRFREYGSDAVTQSRRMVETMLQRNFTDSLEKVHNALMTSYETRDLVAQEAAKVMNLSTDRNALESVLDQQRVNITTIQSNWQSQAPELNQSIDDIEAKFEEIKESLEKRKEYTDKEQEYFDLARNMAVLNRDIVTSTRQLMTKGTEAYESMKASIQEITGMVQIALYMDDDSAVLMKVVQAKDLLKRDLNPGTSDPYVVITTIPEYKGIEEQRTGIINDTVNPVWPTDDVYIFELKAGEVSHTKVRLVVYDYDPDKEDDFLGEVVIELPDTGQLGPEVITTWHRLTSQGLSDISYADFNAEGSSLLDASQMLANQLAKWEVYVAKAEKKLVSAEAYAQQLVDKATEFEEEFAQARNHSASAMTAIGTFHEIGVMVNNSLVNSLEAKRTVDELNKYLELMSIAVLESMSHANYVKSRTVYNSTMQRNYITPGHHVYMRSETLDNPDSHDPPKSVISIDGVELGNLGNGHNVVVIDYVTGEIEQQVNFKTSIEQEAGKELAEFLKNVPDDKIVGIVKQKEGSIFQQYQRQVFDELRSIGGQLPLAVGQKGSFALLGFKGDKQMSVVSWIRQVQHGEKHGNSIINVKISFKSKLEIMWEEAKESFDNAMFHWSDIKELFPQLKHLTDQMREQAAIYPEIMKQLDKAEKVATSTLSVLEELQSESQRCKEIASQLTRMVETLNSSIPNVASLIQEGFDYVNQAETKMDSDENPNSDVINALTKLSNQKTARQQLDNVLESAKNKLSSIKKIVSKMQFAMRITEPGFTTYHLRNSHSAGYQAFSNDISFNLRVNSSDGVIVVLTDPSSPLEYLAISLEDYHLVAVYNLSGQTVRLTHNMKLKNGHWYKIYFMRYSKNLYLTVFADNLHQLTAKTEHADEPLLSWNYANLTVFIGGLPTMTDDFFLGDLDELMVNQQPVNLWNPLMLAPGRVFVNKPNQGMYLPVNSNAVTFFGSGYLVKNMGDCATSSQQFGVQIEFRTFQSVGVLFNVMAESGDVFNVFLEEGKVKLRSGDGDFTLQTSGNQYSNGQWYKVLVERTNTNITLTVTRVGMIPLSETSVYTIGDEVFENAVNITLGALGTKDPAAYRVTRPFSGDMRDLRLCHPGNSTLLPSCLNSDVLDKKDVSYFGVLSGKLSPGMRFYGHHPDVPHGSYAIVKTNNTFLDSLQFTFKTEQPNGLLALFGNDNDTSNIGSINILNAGITAYEHTDGATLAHSTNNVILSDNVWHKVLLKYVSGEGYALYVDGHLWFTGLFGKSNDIIPLRKHLYIGGVPLDFGFAAPAMPSFNGGMKDILLNMAVAEFVETNLVSFGGVISEYVPPPPVPTCKDELSAPEYSTNEAEVRFGFTNSGRKQSYLAYDLTEQQRNAYSSSFVIGIQLRAMAMDGLILYGADNKTNPQDFFSLELSGGHFVYKFNSGGMTHTAKSTKVYAGTGSWIMIYVLFATSAIKSYGAFLIEPSKEFKANQPVPPPPGKLVINTPLYIGGLPADVEVPEGVNRDLGYSGCMRYGEISSSTLSDININFSAPDDGGHETGVSRCLDQIVPGIQFNGSGWIVFDDVKISENFEISIEFRTNTRNGIIFYIINNDHTDATRPSMALEQNNGELRIVTHDGDQNFTTLTWTDPRLTITDYSNSSYYICQMDWHKVVISRQDNKISMTVDSGTTISLEEVFNVHITNDLYVGGIPDNVNYEFQQHEFHFSGCIRNLKLNNVMLEFSKVSNGKFETYGCTP